MAGSAARKTDMSVRETIEIDGHHVGDVECRNLVVRAGASLSGNVRSESFLVEGRFRGNARPLKGRPSKLVVAPDGIFEGEAHVSSIRVQGKVKGILHAFDVHVLKTADVSGGILADNFINDVGSKCKTVTFVGPGMAGPDSRVLLEGVRSVVDMGFVRTPLAKGDGRVSDPSLLDDDDIPGIDMAEFERDLALSAATQDRVEPSDSLAVAKEVPQRRMPFLVSN